MGDGQDDVRAEGPGYGPSSGVDSVTSGSVDPLQTFRFFVRVADRLDVLAILDETSLFRRASRRPRVRGVKVLVYVSQLDHPFKGERWNIILSYMRQSLRRKLIQRRLQQL